MPSASPALISHASRNFQIADQVRTGLKASAELIGAFRRYARAEVQHMMGRCGYDRPLERPQYHLSAALLQAGDDVLRRDGEFDEGYRDTALVLVTELGEVFRVRLRQANADQRWPTSRG